MKHNKVSLCDLEIGSYFIYAKNLLQKTDVITKVENEFMYRSACVVVGKGSLWYIPVNIKVTPVDCIVTNKRG